MSHSVHWINSVRTYAETIWDQPVDTITDATAREIVLQLWKAIPKTAPRVRARFEAIMDYAKAHNWYTGENPFRLKGNLKPVLPGKKRLEQEHFGALDYRAFPQFLAVYAEIQRSRICVLSFRLSRRCALQKPGLRHMGRDRSRTENLDHPSKSHERWRSIIPSHWRRAPSKSEPVATKIGAAFPGRDPGARYLPRQYRACSPLKPRRTGCGVAFAIGASNKQPSRASLLN